MIDHIGVSFKITSKFARQSRFCSGCGGRCSQVKFLVPISVKNAIFPHCHPGLRYLKMNTVRIHPLNETKVRKSYLNSKIMLQNSKIGKGLFAKEFLSKGELIINWEPGPGILMSTEEAFRHETAGNRYTLQIDHNLHLVSIIIIEECDYINHSCDPNCGLKNAYQIIAMRDIHEGEEVCFDYAMSEAVEHFFLHCECGSKQCRKIVTGNDWRIKDLQIRYGKHFSPYILKKINGNNHDV